VDSAIRQAEAHEVNEQAELFPAIKKSPSLINNIVIDTIYTNKFVLICPIIREGSSGTNILLIIIDQVLAFKMHPLFGRVGMRTA